MALQKGDFILIDYAAKVKETPEVKKDAGKDEKKNRKNLRKMAEEKMKNL